MVSGRHNQTTNVVPFRTRSDSDRDLMAVLCDGCAALSPGDPANLVLVPASSIEDALARRPSGRIVFKGGRQVAGPEL